MDNHEGIVIRGFAKNDRQLVVDFFDQMGGETRVLFCSEGNRKVALSFFDGDPKDKVFFLAELNGRMVGYVFLYETLKVVCWLGIAVSEDMKGKHLGGRLIQHAKDYAKQLGMGGIMLTTHIANLRGQGLYIREGFERLGIHSSGEQLFIFRFDNQ